MILTKAQIEKDILNGNIHLNQNGENLKIGPNSIDVHLAPTIKTYIPLNIKKKGNVYEGVPDFSETFTIDIKKKQKVYEYNIPKEGLILHPGVLYLGSTIEAVGSDGYVPMYEGRSSMARYGIQSHISAGFGDIGFKSNWTLEITVTHKTILYPNIRIGQVYFIKPYGNIETFYSGKYVDQKKATESKAFEDFE